MCTIDHEAIYGGAWGARVGNAESLHARMWPNEPRAGGEYTTMRMPYRGLVVYGSVAFD